MDPFGDTLYNNAINYVKTLCDLKKTMIDSKFFYVYVLLLDNYDIYVGQTNNIYLRLFQHATGEGGAKWVTEKGPIRCILEIVINAKKDDEKYKTLQYMDKYGWENVRGAHWTKVDMNAPPRELEIFEDDRIDFKYLDAKELLLVEQKYRSIMQTFHELTRSDFFSQR